jgi:hypothetical protein
VVWLSAPKARFDAARFSAPDVETFAAKNIVYRASHITVPGMPGMECPFNLRSYCRKVLNRRRHWLD